jgi:hypothetical protein
VQSRGIDAAYGIIFRTQGQKAWKSDKVNDITVMSRILAGDEMANWTTIPRGTEGLFKDLNWVQIYNLGIARLGYAVRATVQ